jgi:hypothetical protein
MENRFQKIRELGSKGKRSNPLLLDEFQWDNEWVCESDPVHEGDDGNITWSNVDEVIGATEGLQGRHFPRAAAAHASSSAASGRMMTYVSKKRPRNQPTPTPTPVIPEDDDGDEQDEAMEEDDDSAAAGTEEDAGFHLNDDLLE